MAVTPRKILCLHGAMLSADIFRLQLQPYLQRLEEEQGFVFHFVNAPIVTPAHESIAAFYDEPCYRYFHWDPSPVPFDVAQIFDAFKYLSSIIERQGPFDGVIGFSQGSVMSIALMRQYAKQHPDAPPDALFRFAILFSSPHLNTTDKNGEPLIPGKVQIPSLHICGRNDTEWFQSSQRVFAESFEEGTATMIVHNGAHVVPKDPPTVQKIIDAIEDIVNISDANRDFD